MGAAALIGMGIMLVGTSGSQVISGQQSIEAAKRNASLRCQQAQRLAQYAQALEEQRQQMAQQGSLADGNVQMVAGIAADVFAMARSVQQNETAFKRTLVVTVIVEALATSFLIFVLIRSKEKRDSVFSFL
jgi:hypothetical protein